MSNYTQECGFLPLLEEKTRGRAGRQSRSHQRLPLGRRSWSAASVHKWRSRKKGTHHARDTV